MSSEIYGIDFGTSNSVISLCDGQSERLLDLGQDGPVIPSLLYFGVEGDISIGQEAVQDFLAANRRWQNQNVSLYDKFRFFQAIKLMLKEEDYIGTKIFKELWKVEDIIGVFLKILKEKADRESGKDIRRAVFGRPVAYATDPEADRFLQQKFEKACRKAGFEEIHFVYEPTAAMFSCLSKAEGRTLIFDFGGGTLDVTIAEVEKRNVKKTLANEGIYLGGYIVDEDIVKAKLLDHFGSGSYYWNSSSEKLAFPLQLTKQVESSFAIPMSTYSEIREITRRIKPRSLNRRAVEALEQFMDENLFFDLYQAVDRTKIELSSHPISTIKFQKEPAVDILEEISRAGFEKIIYSRLKETRQLIDRSLEKSGLKAADIDNVFLIGGSSQIPAFVELLEDRFPGKIKRGNFLTDVASGLVSAYEEGYALK